MLFGFIFPMILCQYTWYICPADGLYFWPFPPALECDPNPVFKLTEMSLPFIGKATLYPIQLHGKWNEISFF